MMPLITAGPNLFVGPILQLLAVSQITSEEIRLACLVAEDLCSPFDRIGAAAATEFEEPTIGPRSTKLFEASTIAARISAPWGDILE